MNEIHNLNSVDDKLNRFSMIFIGLQDETSLTPKLFTDGFQEAAARFGNHESARANGCGEIRP